MLEDLDLSLYRFDAVPESVLRASSEMLAIPRYKFEGLRYMLKNNDGHRACKSNRVYLVDICESLNKVLSDRVNFEGEIFGLYTWQGNF